jgi:hypothetical protein
MAPRKIPKRWKTVLDEQNMLWIADNDSGNKVPVARRAVYAIVAPTIVMQTHRVHKQYLKAGVENSKLIVVRRMGHHNPPTAEFREAIQFLDVRTASIPKANEPPSLPD